jgi:alpha-L-rhamnosidase
MYRVMAGLETDEAAPGYKHVLVQPRPGGGFTRVRASHQTPYGRVSSAWTLEGGRLQLAVEVPANTRATVRLPGPKLPDVTESGRPVAGASGVTGQKQDGDAVVVEVGSGRYAFAYPAGS